MLKVETNPKETPTPTSQAPSQAKSKAPTPISRAEDLSFKEKNRPSSDTLKIA